MDVNQVFGYIGALIVGLVLGLIGGGGSILTVPILVYLIGLNPVVATAYSLFVVGTTSLFGAIQNFRNKMVDVRLSYDKGLDRYYGLLDLALAFDPLEDLSLEIRSDEIIAVLCTPSNSVPA